MLSGQHPGKGDSMNDRTEFTLRDPRLLAKCGYCITYVFLFAATFKESTNLVGIFLHGLISPIITMPVGACGTVILDQTLDPTYFWLRKVTIISSKLQLFIRAMVIFCVALHTAIVIFGFGVIGVNIILLILETLERVPSSTCSKQSSICKFATDVQTYRQLQIITHVTNIVFWYVLPVLSLEVVIGAVIMGYMLIKMTGNISYVVVILEMMLNALIFGFILIAFPLGADVIKKSVDSLRILGLQGGVSYSKRQLRSCRPLKIWAGSYFYIHRGTGMMLLGLIAYYTMSSVVSI